MKRRDLLAGAALAGALPARAASTMTLPEMDLHDPFIVTDAATQTYWLFTKNHPAFSGQDAIGVMAYRSRDLKHWHKPELVFQLPPGVWAVDGCWAPEVHRWRGKWYLFVTVHNEGLPLADPSPCPASALTAAAPCWRWPTGPTARSRLCETANRSCPRH